MTLKHTLEEISDDLPKLNYIPLLKSIQQALKGKNIFRFSEDGDRLLISAYRMAFDIATSKAAQQLNPLTQSVGVRAATVNHTSTTEFLSYIKAISDELRTQLDAAVG